MIATFIVGVVAVLIYYVYVYQDKRVKDLVNQIPGPPGLPILGNAHQVRFGHEWYKQILGWSRDYLDDRIFKVWLAGHPVVAFFTGEHIEALLSSTKHIDKSSEYDYIHPWLGTGLLTSTGDKWRVRRKMLTPTFHFNILNDFLDIFNKQASILATKLDARKGGAAGDIFQDVALCALDIICETAMGKTVNAQHQEDSDYVRAVYRMSAMSDERMRKPWYWNDILYYLIGDGKEYKAQLKILHNFTKSVIADRLADFDQKRSELVRKELTGGSTDDVVGAKKKVRLAFLDMLLYMSEGLTKLDIHDIQEEVDTFMFEGHDTTAAAINWATHLIGANPEIQDKVHEELDRVLGNEDRDVTAEDLKELKYLECCIKEALRLYPSVPIFGRTVCDDLVLGKHTVPKGTTTVVITTSLHRDPNVFPDPDVFNPDRFLLENSKSRHPYSYIPFSAGPRNCIGQKFAMMEEKVVLAHLFRKFSIKSTQQRSDLRPVGDLILRPENGILVELKPRS